jgi:hypothetical protein
MAVAFGAWPDVNRQLGSPAFSIIVTGKAALTAFLAARLSRVAVPRP